jgi:hypothetical protein
MGDGIRVGLGLGVLATLACIAGGFGCSSNGADPAPKPTGEAPPATDPSSPSSPPPPPPPSPLPSQLQLDGGAGGVPDDAATAPPVDPGLRTMWALDGANRLVRFSSTAPADVTTLAVAGLPVGEHLLGVDVRPADGKLYALGATSRLYVVDRGTGVAMPVGTKAFAPALAGIAFGFAVNPVADKVRVQSDFDQNLRIDPTTGTATSDGMLSFAAGDPNQFQSPNLIASAYTNSVSGAPADTLLYALDSTRDLLTKLVSPNDGQVTTVGALGIDITDVAGFHIWGGTSASGSTPLQAYAVLMTDATESGLYTIDLDSGAATLVGAIGSKLVLHGLAVEP